ncbi:hypothetical protein Q1695_004508 [Nippostrongylus brasiliensis]|nr:hypothetical protein Q1695_004508 [Nippostrongylus brasiliensis]
MKRLLDRSGAMSWKDQQNKNLSPAFLHAKSNSHMFFASILVVGVWSSQIPIGADANGLPYDVNDVLLRQKRDNVIEGSVQNNRGKSVSRYLTVVYSHLVKALKSNEAVKDVDIRSNLRLAYNQLFEIRKQAKDEQKLHVTMKMLTTILSIRDSVENALKSSSPDLDFVDNVMSVIYWLCESITTYDFPEKSEVKKISHTITVRPISTNDCKAISAITISTLGNNTVFYVYDLPHYNSVAISPNDCEDIFSHHDLQTITVLPCIIDHIHSYGSGSDLLHIVSGHRTIREQSPALFQVIYNRIVYLLLLLRISVFPFSMLNY